VSTTDPSSTARYSESITETTNTFRFSAQLARRLGPLSGRFGIMESTGGVGLDWHLFHDRLELTQDLFGFDEHPTARWRVGLAWELLDTLWLFGGGDDLLSSERRDYLLGLRLRFDDADLKPILPFLPSTR
jgi:phospholipid/cholesterol/gamma-HCH transport system substrate-binding protein